MAQGKIIGKRLNRGILMRLLFALWMGLTKGWNRVSKDQRNLKQNMESAENLGKENAENVWLPLEVTREEILSRLPVKTIFRFRCVCKLWDSLPFDTDFIDLHLSRSRETSSVLMLSNHAEEGHNILSFYSLDIENGNRTKLLFTLPLFLDVYAMEPSCNGLICFSALLRQEIFVCNPSTHEVIQLPKVDFDDPGVDLCKVAGFGVDPVTRKYKVLCAFQYKEENAMKCFIFTLGSSDGGNWRQLDDIPCVIKQMENAYLNGAVHWLIERGGGLLSFSFRDEEYRLVSLPNCTRWKSHAVFSERGYSVYLKVIRGYLHLISTVKESDAGFHSFFFWKLKDYISEVWSFEFEIRVEMICESMEFGPPVPLDIQNGGVILSSGNKLYIHDTETNISREINSDLPGEDEMIMNKTYQPNHAESFVSIIGNYWN